MRVTSKDVLNGAIGPLLVRMATPMVAGIFSMMLFGAVDTYFISLLGSRELAAIGFTLPVSMLIINMTLGLSVGTSVLVGRAIGTGNAKESARIVTDSILYTAGFSILVVWVGLLSIDPLFLAMGASATLGIVHEYMDIYYLFVPLFILPMVGNACVRATGDTKWPSLLMIGSGVVNLILDPIFIFGWGPVPGMGVRGAAYATVISWAIGFIGVGWMLYSRERLILLQWPNWRLFTRASIALTKISLPISLANMMMPIAGMAITYLVSQFGEIAVAGLGAGQRLESFALMIPFAVTAALSPFMAQNLSANQLQRAHEGLCQSIRFIMILQFAIVAVFSGGGYWLASIFSSDPEVLKVTRIYLWVMPIGIGCYGVMIVLNTAFNAEKRSDRTLLISAVRILALYIPLAWTGGYFLGLIGIFIGATTGNILGALFGWWYYKKTRSPELLAA